MATVPMVEGDAPARRINQAKSISALVGFGILRDISSNMCVCVCMLCFDMCTGTVAAAVRSVEWSEHRADLVAAKR